MGCGESKVDEKEYHLLGKANFGSLILKNRVMMAAMTRCRADPKTGVPNSIMKDFYSQRAEDAGIVLTECCAVQANGEGFPGNGQAFNSDHFKGWSEVVKAVKKVNGKIFAQIYHCGRSTNKTKINGLTVVSCSAIQNRESTFDMPEELDKKGIESVIKAFVDSAKNLVDIGFDGVEIHGANGYLVDQFLRDCSNSRTDEYGGSIENRCRFALEVVDAVGKAIGYKRVGIKLSPCGRYNDMYDSDPKKLVDYLLPQLNKRKICFVEMNRPPDGTAGANYEKKGEEQVPDLLEGLKTMLPDVVLVGNGNFSLDEADALIKKRVVDMVSFAKLYIANPDLTERWKNKWEIDQPDWSKVYTPGAEGYSDFKKHKDNKSGVEVNQLI